MTFCLNTTIVKPDEGEEIKNAVILLHGYGGDGKDISMLTLNWKRFLKNTVFLCPDGYETCPINPVGFQWFDLSKDDEKYVLNEAHKAENIINKFIEEIKDEYKFGWSSYSEITNGRFAMIGFLAIVLIELFSKQSFLQWAGIL